MGLGGSVKSVLLEQTSRLLEEFSVRLEEMVRQLVGKSVAVVLLAQLSSLLEKVRAVLED